MDTYEIQLQMSGGALTSWHCIQGLADLSLCMTNPKVAIIIARFFCCVVYQVD